MNDWIKGLKVDAKNDLIIAWESEVLCFYSLSTRDKLA